uniref:Putative ATP-dependent RNA helicase DDX11 n=1 Tax=Aegilops tauschii TaxID=37682 RepID=R7WDR5_AEGTA
MVAESACQDDNPDTLKRHLLRQTPEDLDELKTINENHTTGDGGGSGRNMKPVQLPKTLRITAARASPNQSVRATILDRTRVNVKDDTTTRISKLTGRKQIHEGECSVREASVTEPAVPVEEEPDAASGRLSLRISCSVKAMAEAGEGDDEVPEEDDRALRSVVIIDEAHNLADSLTSMYNSKVESSQLRAVLSHLEAYLNRFQNVLGAGNRRYIQTLTVLTRSFLRCLISNEDCSSAVTSMTINKFLFSLDIDNINIVKLCQYLKESNIVHKVSGYANKLFITENGVCNLNHGQQHGEGSSITSFQALTDLLRSLLYCNDDGRIIVARHKPGGQPEDAYIKFVMLCAEKTFSEVTDDAHVVIMAGGTLQPIEETRLRLFPGLLPSDIKFFSCNHIVPPESILPIAVTCGPSGKKFDFSHSSRSSLNMIEELGRFLCNIVTIVPEGIVMFFSSYEYEKQVYDAWMASGTISKISKKKHVFREPRSSVDVEVILNKYKEAIQSCSKGSGDTSVNGALLLAVVGGKISEGINFSDGMGRCVLMVGLPYPSPDDIELMETIKHIGNYSTSSVIGDDKPFNGNDECKLEPGFDVLRKSGKSGREYYENLCMKAVNQSIGRAIRHVNDYAAMLLVDSRYKSGKSGREYYENLCMKAVNQSIGRAIRHVNDYAAMLLVDSRYAHTS